MGLKNILKESKGKSNNIAGLFNEIRNIKNSYTKSLTDIFLKYDKAHKKLEQIESELLKEYKINKIDYDFQLITDTDNNNFKEIQIELDIYFDSDNVSEDKIDELFENLFGRMFINGYYKNKKYNVYINIKNI